MNCMPAPPNSNGDEKPDKNSFTKPPSSKSLTTVTPSISPQNPQRADENRPPTSKLSERSAMGGFPFMSRLVGRNFVVSPELLMSGGYTVVDSNESPITSGNHLALEPNEATTVVAAPNSPLGDAVVASTTTLVIPSGQESLIGEREVEGRTRSPPSSNSVTNSATAIEHVTGETWGRRKRSEAICQKRKMKEIEESLVATTNNKAISRKTEDLELDSDDEKKQSRDSSAAQRNRAAEVHNLSERRCQDKINEKMRALQQLIPHCNKSEEISLLDEAIKYTKSLQTQLQFGFQMMSMGYGMVSSIYHGMQPQYMPPMGIGIMPPYMPAIPIPALPSPTVPTITGPIVMPPLAPRLPAMPSPLSSIQLSNPANFDGNSYLQIPVGMPQIPDMVDPYQQFLIYQQMMQGMQGTPMQPVSSKSSSTKSACDNEKDV
ncbi:hypothetical protein RND81_09G041800 [Saponaria officinalis]|uniref:BHLH domain-containing protein n=1 Tax=Saponaria officinalis TaxID=3572 RepID=A0AAW1IHD0_SAPOF